MDTAIARGGIRLEKVVGVIFFRYERHEWV